MAVNAKWNEPRMVLPLQQSCTTGSGRINLWPTDFARTNRWRNYSISMSESKSTVFGNTSRRRPLHRTANRAGAGDVAVISVMQLMWKLLEPFSQLHQSAQWCFLYSLVEPYALDVNM